MQKAKFFFGLLGLFFVPSFGGLSFDRSARDVYAVLLFGICYFADSVQ